MGTSAGVCSSGTATAATRVSGTTVWVELLPLSPAGVRPLQPESSIAAVSTSAIPRIQALRFNSDSSCSRRSCLHHSSFPEKCKKKEPSAESSLHLVSVGEKSTAHLSLAQHHILIGGQSGKPHGAPGVELLGGDADLGAQPELEPI